MATHAGNIAQCAVYTPFVYMERDSLDAFEIDTIPGFNNIDDATAFLSFSYDGVTFGTEASLQYGQPSDYSKRFIARRMGYIDRRFLIKIRWASTSRMAFGAAVVNPDSLLK